MRLMPINLTERLGATSPGTPGWNNPITPCFFSPVRSSKISVFVAGDAQLVAWNERQSAPGQELRTKDGGGGWWYPAAGAFSPEGGNGARMGQEEGWLLPDFCDQFVEIVGSRAAFFARLDLLRRNNTSHRTVW